MIDLACLAQRLRAQGRTLALRSPQPHIRTLIELVGLHRMPAVALLEPTPA
jgi:anti-anti-sigma regulatory factor